MSTIVPYAKIDGVEYNFGVKKITVAEQKHLINLTEWDFEFDNKQQENNYKLFEGQDGKILLWKKENFERKRIYGYCKMSDCRKKGVKSIPRGIYVGYHCVDCLSNELVRGRELAKGCDIMINFTCRDNSIEPEKLQSYDELPVKFIEYNGRPMVTIMGKLYDYQKFYHTDNLPILDITTCYYTNRGKSYLYGLFKGYIMGREVCANIIMGKQCMSLTHEFDIATFHAKTILPGVPGWREGHRIDECGKILVHEKCPACAFYNPRAMRKEKANSGLIGQIKQKDADIEYWREKLAKSEIENAQLRAENAHLRAQLHAQIDDNN